MNMFSTILGFKKFMKDIQEVMGIWIPRPLYAYWAVTWLFITPVLLIVSIKLVFFQVENICSKSAFYFNTFTSKLNL